MTGRVVCLSGFKGAGKDWIKVKMFPDSTRLALADYLKEDVSRMYEIPLKYFHDVELKDKFHEGLLMTPRQKLIEHATEMRKKDVHFFVDKIIKQIDDQHDYVITDARFFSEIWRMSKLFGKRMTLLWVKREGCERGDDSIELTEADCDATIYNKIE